MNQNKEENIMELPDIELVAEKVHDAWWETKQKAGFHAPHECESDNKKSYLNASWQNQDRFDDHFDADKYKWCDKCHPDMIPYSNLEDNIKEYDRVTVRTVYEAIKSLIF